MTLSEWRRPQVRCSWRRAHLQSKVDAQLPLMIATAVGDCTGSRPSDVDDFDRADAGADSPDVNATHPARYRLGWNIHCVQSDRSTPYERSRNRLNFVQLQWFAVDRDGEKTSQRLP